MRAAAGGLLFGIPLLFTLEVWEVGAAATPPQMAVALAVSFLPVALLVQTAGFRRARELRLSGILREAVAAVAVGVVCSAAVLVLLRQITLGTPLADAVGKIVYEAGPFAIGAAVACHILSQSPDESDDGPVSASARSGLPGTLADLGSTSVGAVFVALNIAPTEEVSLLAAASSPPLLLAIAVATLVISYGIVFQAGFRNQAARREQRGVLQHPITETVVAYLVSLVAAGLMLRFFGVLDGNSPWPLVLDHVIILGFPAAIGGAAGRLAI